METERDADAYASEAPKGGSEVSRGGRKLLRGGHDPVAAGKRGGKRSGEVRRKRAEASATADERSRNGSVETSGDADTDLDLAVGVLRTIAADKAAPDSARVSASRALLEHGIDPEPESSEYDDLDDVELANVLLGLAGKPPVPPDWGSAPDGAEPHSHGAGADQA